MEKNYAKGIYLTKRKSATGKEYLELSVKNGEIYDKYNCFESDKKDKYGNNMFIIYIKNSNESVKKQVEKDSDLPF